MSEITIEVWDATGNKKQLVQLPSDAAVNRVIAVLVSKMNLPQHSPDGQLMSYKFQHRATGRQLLDTETLSSAGVSDGDIVRLQPEITAGAVFRQEAGGFRLETHLTTQFYPWLTHTFPRQIKHEKTDYP